MKTAIYYFSATGNSLVVARDLAAELGEADMIPITKVFKGGTETIHDCVGIVFPVYMFGLPLIIAEFLKKLQFKKDAYIFIVATFGGLFGRALALAKHTLAKRGIQLASGFSIRMPGNYTPLYGAIAREKQDAMFANEKLRVREIAVMVREKKQCIISEGLFFVNMLLYVLLYRIGSLAIRKSDKHFWVDEKCNNCGLCARVCPVTNIEMRDGRPAWLHHCEQCMACLQWCSVEAIQYSKATAGRKRYRHPNVNSADIAAQHREIL